MRPAGAEYAAVGAGGLAETDPTALVVEILSLILIFTLRFKAPRVPGALVFWALAILFIGIAIRHTRGEFGERQIPLMGVMAAFIFAAQMINFPVAGGTSGHLLGGALAANVLGPWAGILVMTTVIAVQALVFQDGGFVVMSANIFNMASSLF